MKDCSERGKGVGEVWVRILEWIVEWEMSEGFGEIGWREEFDGLCVCRDLDGVCF